MKYLIFSFFTALTLLPQFAEAGRRNYDRYYYEQEMGQQDAEMQYSASAFSKTYNILQMLANGSFGASYSWESSSSTTKNRLWKLEEARKIPAAKLVQINKIEDDMAKVIMLRTFVDPVRCVVDCDGAEAVTKKIRSLHTAFKNLKWENFSYDEIALLQARAEGLQKLSYVEAVTKNATLLEICSSASSVSYEYPDMRIFSSQSTNMHASNFQAVGKNKVTFDATLDYGDSQAKGECYWDENGHARLSAGGFELVNEANKTADGQLVRKRGWHGTKDGTNVGGGF